MHVGVCMCIKFCVCVYMHVSMCVHDCVCIIMNNCVHFVRNMVHFYIYSVEWPYIIYYDCCQLAGHTYSKQSELLTQLLLLYINQYGMS
jgi:hypothetical protein